MDFGIVGFASITALSYLMALFVKATKLPNNWLPLLCGVFGAILGVVALYIVPDFPANNVLAAASIGAISGLAATGVNETGKQLGKLNDAN